MRRHWFVAGLALAVATACSEHTAPPNNTSSVSVQDNQFSPANATVTVGTTVTWTWAGANQHNVTFTGGPASATQVTGTYQRQFTAAGTFNYQCSIHGASMSGSVTVN